jgi:hypothetical protein
VSNELRNEEVQENVAIALAQQADRKYREMRIENELYRFKDKGIYHIMHELIDELNSDYFNKNTHSKYSEAIEKLHRSAAVDATDEDVADAIDSIARVNDDARERSRIEDEIQALIMRNNEINGKVRSGKLPRKEGRSQIASNNVQKDKLEKELQTLKIMSPSFGRKGSPTKPKPKSDSPPSNRTRGKTDKPVEIQVTSSSSKGPNKAAQGLKYYKNKAQLLRRLKVLIGHVGAGNTNTQEK